MEGWPWVCGGIGLKRPLRMILEWHRILLRSALYMRWKMMTTMMMMMMMMISEGLLVVFAHLRFRTGRFSTDQVRLRMACGGLGWWKNG